MEVSPAWVEEILQLVSNWLTKLWFTRNQLEKLLGKLQFMAACIWLGRVFISRMLNTLLTTECMKRYQMDLQLTKDLEWWEKFLVQYNGVSVMWMEQLEAVNQVLTTDTSLKCIGGYLIGKEYFYYRLPVRFRFTNIAYMELIAVIVALKVWGDWLSEKRIVIGCDNQSVVAVVNNGKSRDLFLQAGMREVVYLLSIHKCELQLRFVLSTKNEVSDWLSRWWDLECRKKFRRFSRGKLLTRRTLAEEMLGFSHKW